ncbi:phage tail protein [Cellulomonas humilata]|uniref:phage tail protein n=1 Tax=Cellulomonas humilata TaxID=144055 RepID=UPI001584C0AF|nr:hypothetical protein [Cellulomonas humilata]
MPGAHRPAGSTRDPTRAVGGALVEGRRRAVGGPSRAAGGPLGLLALQRAAGNAAVSALMAAKLRGPSSQATGAIDSALREIRQDEPAIDVVEKGLVAARDTGVPVDLEGPKPPASALAVTRTGFGPESVPSKKPVAPPKPVPAKSPLGRAGVKGGAGVKGAGTGGHGPSASTPGTGAAGGGPAAAGPGVLPADARLLPPVPPAGTSPAQDPAFRAVSGGLAGSARGAKAHPSAASKATEAQDAAVPPTDDVAGQAKAAKVDAMDAQQPGAFDKKAFIAAVKTAIEAKSPKTLKEADSYKESGKAGEVKGEVKGLVSQGADGQAQGIASATAAAPDPSSAVPKPVSPMPAEQPSQVAPVPGAGAAPKPAPPEQINLEAGRHEANDEMAQAEVTDQQLAQSGEPQFEQALGDKQAAAAHADAAPAQFRAQEQQVIAQHKTDATEQTGEAVTGMRGAKMAALAKVVADKGAAKAKDEERRAEVTAKVQAIFTATEADVKLLLDGLDPKVDAAFDTGEKGARATFESFVSAKMSAYKKDRYGGWLGGLRWAKDKLLGMPSKVDEFYAAGRELYLKEMDGVISRVADIVAADLSAAKKRIASGKAEIATYVKGLPADLKKVGAQASSEVGEKFEQLESDVADKQSAVVDALATKYVEARKGLDERIEELQAANKGLVDKAIGAIKAVINTIRELVAMLTGVLARAASVVGDIVKDPIGFLGNLIAGVKGGILKFKDNILEHLRKGLMSWLFGALAEGGVELPETFDLKGIVQLLASLFGLTWTTIRNRIVRKIGEKAMGAAEKGVEIFKVFAAEGVGGLWQMLVEKLGDLKEMILEQVKDFVITRIITAGITWLIGLLNPAAAFIKACKLIYDVVMFFITNGSRIMQFVNTVLDSVADIVRGNVSGVIAKIDDVLGQMVPLIIGFLASAIGLGGIGQKIRQIIDTLQKPVTKALDFVIATGLKLAGPLIRGMKGISGKVKAKVAAGKAWVKGKVESVRDGGVTSALRDANALLRASNATQGSVRAGLAGLRQRHQLGHAELVASDGHTFHVHVQREEGDTADVALDEHGEGEQAVSVWEDTAGKVNEESMAGLQTGRVPGAGAALGQMRAVPVQLSEISIQRIRSMGDRWIDAAPGATTPQRDAARRRFHSSIDAAATSREEMGLARRLRTAASAIQTLYGGRDVFSLDVEHLDEVAQNRDIYPRSAISRRYARISAEVRAGGQPGSVEERIARQAGNAAAARQIARLYAEQQIEEALGESVRSTGGHEDPVELDLEIIETDVHARVTARRAAARR